MSTENKIVLPDSLKNSSDQAAINALVSAAVREAITAMGPVLERVALTPEKILEMEKQRRAPSEDEVRAKQRESRERAMMREDLAEAERTKQLTQKTCTHKDSNGRWSVCRISNFPDRAPRLVCCRCHRFFQPTHWEIGAPDKDHPRGCPVILKADENYAAILGDLNQYQNSI